VPKIIKIGENLT